MDLIMNYTLLENILCPADTRRNSACNSCQPILTRISQAGPLCTEVYMIRLILVALLLGIYFILSLPIMGILWLVRKFITPKAELFMQRIVQFALWVVWHVSGVKLTTIGLENIPDDQPVLFVGNHLSYFDVVIAYSQMKNRTIFIGKASLEKIPFLSWNMKFLRCLFIDRTNMRQGVKTIMEAAEMTKEGISVFIYPEGMRNTNGDELKLHTFHDGSFKVAQRGPCPIIPVAITNTANIFENHIPWIKATRVVIEYGKPVTWDELDKDTRKHIGDHFQQVILEMLRKNQPLTLTDKKNAA